MPCETAGDDLRAFVEYDDETYNPLFIDERTVEEFGGAEAVEEFADQLHYNYKLDFTEQEMYADLYEPLSSLDAFAVYLEDETIVRYVDDGRGIYVSIQGETYAGEVIDVLTDVLEEQ
ncbi:hypothetical protein M0R89_18195 [Halorussus limi]|uniref:Uncharacterized protein n=1 Tax=Halorussus limi TaxID=2938695 RepID=A0A8U0HU41_9EURY|nr:hypothetical protein [Halorussus limi]UPV74448.1 hypothetical protein M0R89_18195 [Halorussus limi]